MTPLHRHELAEVFTDIRKAPLDEYLLHDEGDAESDDIFEGTMNEHRALQRVPLNAGTVSLMYVIPFTRPLTLGDKGKDVVGAKRAIWRADGLDVPVRATETFGAIAVKNLKKFQRAHHLVADGVLGEETLKKLTPYFDAYAYLLYVGYPPGSTVRDRIVAYCLWAYNNRGAIGYAQYRPMSYLNALQHLPINEDCSTFATKAYKYAGGPDPNGLHFDGYGNTGTMRQHGTRVSLSSCLPGDLAHYDNPQHVGVVVVGGSNARVVEHGSTDGPLLIGIGYRPLTEIRRYL